MGLVSIATFARSSSLQRKRREKEQKMVTMQWCGAVARRVLASPRPAAAAEALPSAAPIVCGRGDKKTKKGKRFKGSYGKVRPKKEKMIERIKDKVEVPRSTPWPLPFKLI
ncbi:hypothetical protein WN944_029220 [Citrus x changshan-huyou]|nr:30S ribosomal protein S31 [Citrus sinensis]